MFDITALSPRDVITLLELKPVAEEAIRAANAIEEVYTFHRNEERITVWKDGGGNYEFLTRQGVWQARYLHQRYDVYCTADEIFKYLRVRVLVKAGYTSDNNPETRELLEVCGYLEGFIQNTYEKLPKTT